MAMNSKKNCLLVILVMWSSVLLFSAHARCPTRNDTHCTSINATQCPTDPSMFLITSIVLRVMLCTVAAVQWNLQSQVKIAIQTFPGWMRESELFTQ